MKNAAEDIVKTLSAFPNRACSGKYAPEVLTYLSGLFSKYDVDNQKFKTPKNYLLIVFWLILGLVSGLWLSLFMPFLGFLLSLLFAVFSIRYFNWYPSIITRFPPQFESSNLIINKSNIVTKRSKKFILMAHWDSAPISFLYHPKRVGLFRSSLKINLVIISLSVLLSFLNLFIFQHLAILAITGIFSLYFIVQLILSSMDFWRFSYSKGASDNATGVAAAIQTAKNIWENADINLELVLTGAEEVGMIGSKAYFDKKSNEFDENTFLINFDTLGAGNLKVISKTGSWGDIDYNNRLSQKFLAILNENKEYAHIKQGEWHTGDFDSVWFIRAGIPSITLAALDDEGKMPNIHRPTDTLENVDFKPMHDAVSLATEVISCFGKN